MHSSESRKDRGRLRVEGYLRPCERTECTSCLEDKIPKLNGKPEFEDRRGLPPRHRRPDELATVANHVRGAGLRGPEGEIDQHEVIEL